MPVLNKWSGDDLHDHDATQTNNLRFPFHHPVDFLGVLQNDHIPIFQLRRASDNADIIIFGSTRNRVTGVCGNIDVGGKIDSYPEIPQRNVPRDDPGTHAGFTVGKKSFPGKYVRAYCASGGPSIVVLKDPCLDPGVNSQKPVQVVNDLVGLAP